MLKKLRRLIPRLSQPSTWRGFVLIATAAGATWSPEHQVAVVNTGLLLTGLVGAFIDDKPEKPAP
jgi:hypothetical protein